MSWGDGLWGASEWGTGDSDTTAPVLQNLVPLANQTNVAENTTVTIEIVDDGSLVLSATVELYVNGVLAWQSDANQNSFTTVKTIITNGFRYVVTPPVAFADGSTATIHVKANNQANVPLDTSYQFFLLIASPPLIINVQPGTGSVDVPIDTTLSFDLYDPNGDYAPATVQIIVNEIVAYASLAQQNGHIVVVTAIPNGQHFVITFPINFTLNATVEGLVYAADFAGNAKTSLFTFQTIKQPNCFAGPSSSTESALLSPYTLAKTKLKNTEEMRKELLHASTQFGNPTEAIRVMYLRAFFDIDLAPILNKIVTPPSKAERTVRLCNKSTMLDMSDALRSKGNKIPASIKELSSLGLPSEHIDLLNTYAQVDEPSTEIPLACLLVFLAKALESPPGGI